MPSINCFCAAQDNTLTDLSAAPRPRRLASTDSPRASVSYKTKPSRRLHRNGSAASDLSTSSWTSNSSIARLPPCRKRDSDAKVEAMMMPMPHDARPSRCLRLSHPRTYGALVSDMKACKGTRDWRNFDVFHADEVDESVSAVERAKERAADFERRLVALSACFQEQETAAIRHEVEMLQLLP